MKDKTFFMMITAVAVLGILASFYILFNTLPFPAESGISPETSDRATTTKETFYIGVVSRFPPPIIYQGYQPIADYLTATTDFNFELKLFPSYKDTVTSLVNGEISVAFLGSLIYVETRDDVDIIPILKPLNADKKPFHSSVIISTTMTESNSINLKNKTVALPSGEAFASNWFNHIYLPQRVAISDVPTAIDNFSYHHSVLFEVLKGNYDYGVVKDRVAFEYLDKGIKIVHASEKIPSSPVVVIRNYNRVVIDQMVDALLAISSEETRFRELTKDWDYEFINGFVKASEQDYAPLAQLVKDHFYK